jgi:hypothetical protein
MAVDDVPSNGSMCWAMPEERARVLIDDRGVEWEVYDESTWSIELALDWDILPQGENPGLIFASRLGRRRLYPCPKNWRSLDDRRLIDLLRRAPHLL